uniref:Uncharacterized protein n=1 Tax=Romanomermis culicivorax TaxID=13658 RepID=A0A915J4N8_ROMCU
MKKNTRLFIEKIDVEKQQESHQHHIYNNKKVPPWPFFLQQGRRASQDQIVMCFCQLAEIMNPERAADGRKNLNLPDIIPTCLIEAPTVIRATLKRCHPPPMRSAA